MDPPELEHSLVFFDIETTGLEVTADIIQLGAAVKESICFSQHIFPPGGTIPEDTTRIHGVTLDSGKLYRHGKELSTVDTRQALGQFLEFLKSVDGPVILVGHNIDYFDRPVFCHTLKTYAPELVPEFNNVIIGTVDTLTMARKNISLYDAPNHRLATLLNIFVPDFVYDSHDALGDCQALNELFKMKFQKCYIKDRFVQLAIFCSEEQCSTT